MKRFKWMTAVLMLVMVMSIGLAGCESAAEQGLDDGVGSYAVSYTHLDRF